MVGRIGPPVGASGLMKLTLGVPGLDCIRMGELARVLSALAVGVVSGLMLSCGSDFCSVVESGGIVIVCGGGGGGCSWDSGVGGGDVDDVFCVAGPGAADALPARGFSSSNVSFFSTGADSARLSLGGWALMVANNDGGGSEAAVCVAIEGGGY